MNQSRPVHRILSVALVACALGPAAITFTPASADATRPASVQSAVATFAHKHKHGIRLRLHHPDRLRIHCPVGVLCDARFYRALKTNTRKGELDVFAYVSFSGQLIGNLTTAAVKQHFSYLYVILNHHDLRQKGWDVRLQTVADPYRKGNNAVQIIGYRNGRFQAKLSTRIVRIAGHKTHCAPMDAPVPPACMVSMKVDIPLEVTFDLKAEDGALDCRKQSNRHRCG